MTSSRVRKIVIDTDPGQDDAMALMLALRSSEFDVLALTTVCGNSTIKNTTRNGFYVRDLLGRQDVPIYSGASRPLNRDLPHSIHHGGSGLAGIDPTGEAELSGNAVAELINLVEDNACNITIVALGPLTNIAQAFIEQPAIVDQISELVVMGGAIAAPGNIAPAAEFNIFIDHEAAKTVFDSGVPITMVPLDACNQVWMTPEHVNQIGNPVLKETLSAFINPTSDGAAMYDPLTIFQMLEPEACRFEQLEIQIETAGELTTGMTVADRRSRADRAKANVNVAIHIDAERFFATFVERLS